MEVARVDEHGLPNPSAEDRAGRGRAARAELPRSSHSVLEVGADRDPVALLETQSASRVPELVPIRYERMLASPLAFFRGSATVMACDLASLPRSSLHAQLSGDAHLMNFGGFASPERDLVFDLNDFDETPRPFEWDVKRLAASFEIAARSGKLQATPNVGNAVLGSFAPTARRSGTSRRSVSLDVWYARPRLAVDRQRAESGARPDAGEGARARSRRLEPTTTRVRSQRLIHEVDGAPRFVSEPPLIVPLDELAGDDAVASIRAIYRSYRQPCRRIAAFCSNIPLHRQRTQGRRCRQRRNALLGAAELGRDEHDPLFLQMKEAEASVLEPHLGASGLASHGQRIVEGQRLMQAASDIFLGWVHSEQDIDGSSRDFYVRQLRDWKLSVDLETILPRGLAQYAAACGWTLARAHARTGDRIAIAAYLGGSDTFDRAVAEFAAGYADLNEQDHRALGQALRRPDPGRHDLA